MKKFIKTEGYPKWVYVRSNCRECDKRIAIGEILNSIDPFIFVAESSTDDFLKGDKNFETYLSPFAKDVPNAEPIFPVNKNRTIEDGLEVNDIIFEANGIERKILAVLNEKNQVYALSQCDEFTKASSIFTLSELINIDYKLKSQVDPNTVEMTVEEISKQLGKNVKIVKG